ncbi:MAG: metallophosphoesterase family protein [Terrimicrobiaceae bacterium]|nr:metallophosphatase family protein [Terrimicrobiaceae bacterium]
MRIAVIADTHGTLPAPTIPSLGNADEIWHLGDFCDSKTFQAVRDIGPPVHAVLGNNDHGLDLPASVVLERCGRSFYLIHIPPRRAKGTDFLLHGHTHVPRDERIDGTRFLNPGSTGKPNKGAPPGYAWLTVLPEGRIVWEIVLL